MLIIPRSRWWLTFSAVLVAISIALTFLLGLRFSPDFTEGTLLELSFPSAQEVTPEKLSEVIGAFVLPETEIPLGNISIIQDTEGIFTLKMRRLDPAVSDALLVHLQELLGDVDVMQSRDISPIYAKSFRSSAVKAIAAASLMIILYITFAFRRISRGIKPWKLGIAAIIALLHDLILMIGTFAVLGYFFPAEVDILFITAMLSIMGFSVHNTIVVFDRIRENILHKHYEEGFNSVAERSVHQTLARSINTSLTALLVLIPILLIGASEIFYFVLALAVGIVYGTYTSIFVATPLLTYFQRGESPS